MKTYNSYKTMYFINVLNDLKVQKYQDNSIHKGMYLLSYDKVGISNIYSQNNNTFVSKQLLTLNKNQLLKFLKAIKKEHQDHSMQLENFSTWYNCKNYN